MMFWRDEELIGEPSYDVIAAAQSLSDVRFRLANGVSGGTAMDSENMGAIMQKADFGKCFFYDGATLPRYDFGTMAADGVSGGVILARGFLGQKIWAVGRIYLRTKTGIEILDEPAGHVIEEDCIICGLMGRRTLGTVQT